MDDHVAVIIVLRDLLHRAPDFLALEPTLESICKYFQIAFSARIVFDGYTDICLVEFTFTRHLAIPLLKEVSSDLPGCNGLVRHLLRNEH